MLSESQYKIMDEITARQPGGNAFNAYKTAEELAELQQVILKHFNVGKDKKAQILKESGDVLFNIFYLCHSLGISEVELKEAIDQRMEKVAEHSVKAGIISKKIYKGYKNGLQK